MSAQVAGRSLRFRFLAAAVALLAGGAGLLAATVAGGPAAQATARSSAAPAAWGVAQRIPDLDAIAAKGNLNCPADGNYCGGINIYALSCPAPGDCTAGGDFYGQGENDGTVGEGWVASESDGAWTAPKVIELGQGGFPSYVAVTAVSCASPGNCAAAGYDSEVVEATGYVDTYGAFVINEVNGKWSAPRQIPGTDALNQTNYASASSVSCSAPGDCAVAGTVNGSQEFVATETNGVWGTAELVPGTHYGPGTDAGGGPGTPPVISCPKPGDCTLASGDTQTGSVWSTSVATETDGTWADAVPLPGYAAAGGVVTSLSCPAVGDCSAGGWTYSGKHTVPFVASEVNGAWTSSALPGFAALSPASVDSGSLTALSCGAPGNCSAGGIYRPAQPEASAFLVSEVGGVWQTARPVPGLAKTERGISLGQISCPAAGDCGAIADRAGVGYVLRQSGGTWAQARQVKGVTGTGAAWVISCAAPGICVAGGNDHNITEVWVLARSTAATTLTTVSPAKSKVAYGAEGAQKITVTVQATTPAPAGKVTVTANGKAVCTITLKNGTGSCRLAARQLKPGTYKAVAIYRGAAPYKASSSAAKTFKVTG
ncbi:MAG TPA: Ig-like domain-containing protein [Trebonia sp.]|nr:Ig-like domain-containing protein [Trebonia sp.]